MAALSVADRTRIWRALMRRWSTDKVTCNFLKTELYNSTTNTGAIADVDDWIDTHSGLTGNTTGFNGAFSVVMRAALSADQKTDIFLAVAAMRRGLDYIRSVFGETD
jgi:hypothetical protein